MKERWQREKQAYNRGEVGTVCNHLHKKFMHVFNCPNTLRYEAFFEDTIKQNINNAKILEVGCGTGWYISRLFSLGPSYACGVDISEEQIKIAKQKEISGKLEFKTCNIEEGITGNFDIIFGRSILHHINYKKALKNMFSKLNPGGRMIFMEPLGSNSMLKAYWFITKSAHTLDERPFKRSDIKWLHSQFRSFDYYPFNYFSLLFGILSSLFLKEPNNKIMSLCDAIDCWIANNIPILRPNFRQAVFVIEKPKRGIYENHRP